ncbi:glycosyltransferase [Rhizobium sp. AQ_MP]|uniref:glycosyltransferase family protein n=1 Tax=Rhizobium sp. AQ_MP TaxID=2761536 RepID=UPI001639EFDF|nr:glycosyltransferase [Rhizobium sp. AQ_MP]MBC2775775.1 glycosyltransferase [Rhizobium sp. AQ_MP]
MGVAETFDAVLMLTWSDWKNEPRSNRYHYATRFARSLPVLFFQHCYHQRADISIEPTEIDNIDIVNVNCGLRDSDVFQIKKLLAARGIKRPLLWIYDSMNYQALMDALPTGYRVYHASEDYFTHSHDWNENHELVASSVKSLLSQVNFMVACTEGVAEACVHLGGYKGKYVVVENGCDAEFFIGILDQTSLPDAATRPIAVFQGGINQRLDYDLLHNLVSAMPDWEFRFCGRSVPSAGWERLQSLDNVTYLGELQPEAFAAEMCGATAGIVPFVQDSWIRNSLPLKSYEYVACGLPVVSVPITALMRDGNLFAFATDAETFQSELRRLAPTRNDPELLAERRSAAIARSYEKRFASAYNAILEARAGLPSSGRRLKVAIFYDSMYSIHVSTIFEHLEAFDRYSRHQVTYISATPSFWSQANGEPEDILDLSIFDVAVVHYSTRLSVVGHLDQSIANALSRFNGLKVLYIQDEYEGTEIARNWMDYIRFDLVYTCVPLSGVEKIYPAYRFGYTEFLPTLTGYVPEAPHIDEFALPIEDRSLLIAYRGRKLHPIYGTLGQEKYQIGVEMKAIAVLSQLNVDIEVDDSKRIYGDDWYRFMGSARATLGTESGSNVFDFTGELKKELDRLQAANPDVSFDELYSRVIAPHEGFVRMNQISPKVFEAIRLRTALILFEGDYSGVLTPDEHFIVLKKDFSNFGEVLSKLNDIPFLRNLTQKAYDDIVGSGRYSYRSFVESFDADVSARVLQKNPNSLFTIMMAVTRNGAVREALPLLPVGLYEGPLPVGAPLRLAETASRLTPPGVVVGDASTRLEAIAFETAAGSPRRSIAYRLTRRAWRIIPRSVRYRSLNVTRKIMRDAQSPDDELHPVTTFVKGIWHLMPVFLRKRIALMIKR